MVSILLIDDDQQVREVARALLESLGHEIRIAADGEEGLRIFREQPSPVVVTDLLMPVKEGLETIREIRSLSGDVRILAISGGGRALGAHDVLALARGLGADGILAKPFSRQQLAQAIDALEAA